MFAVRTSRLSPASGFYPAYKRAGKEPLAMNDNIPQKPLRDTNVEFSLADDLIMGAEQIARELQWKMKDGRWNRRKVYYLASQGEAPIYRVKGLGICARRSALKRYFNLLDERRLNPLQGEGQARKG